MKKFCTTIIGLICLICVVSPSFADDLEIGIVAFTNKNYALAYEKLKPLAEQGNMTAQAFIGDLYYDGNGVPRNCELAVNWYTKAAKQGLLYAQFQLGHVNYMGECPHNYDEAFKWFVQAAEQGVVSSQSLLGYMYASGTGTTKDRKRAFYWFNRAAKQGDAKAQCYLGMYYSFGEGGALQDYAQAYAWWNVSASQGNTIAKESMGKLSKKMSPDQIAKAQELSKQLYDEIYGGQKP